MKIILKLKIDLKKNLDLSELSKLNNCNITIKKIKSLKFLYGTNLINIEKVFSIKLTKTKLEFNDFVIEGSSPFFNYLGFNWIHDNLVIHGDVGSYLGQSMKSATAEGGPRVQKSSPKYRAPKTNLFGSRNTI